MNLSCRNYVLLLLLIFFQPSLNGQGLQVTGRITSLKTTQPLASATISFIPVAGKTINEITDRDGRFTIHLPVEGYYNFRVSFSGYRPYQRDSIYITRSLLSSLSFDADLALAETTLQNVEVKAARPFLTQTADKIIIDPAASPVAAGGNAYDLLLAAPGLMEQNSNLQFRGKPVNVLINGRNANLSGDDLKTFLGSMPANSIEKIEILPNPSAAYDAQGASVINIRLAKNKNFGTGGSVSAGIGAGRYLRGNGGLSLNYRNKKLNLYGGLDYVHNAQYYDNLSQRILPGELNIFEKEYETRYRNNQSGKIGLDYDINKNSTAGFLVTDYVNFRDRDLSNTSRLDYALATNNNSSTVSTTGFARLSSLSINTFYKTKIDTLGKELTVNVNYFNYDKNWNDDFVTRFYSAAGAENKTPYLLHDDSPTFNFVGSVTADYTQAGKIHQFEAGAKATYSRNDNNVRWQYNDAGAWQTDIGKTNHFIYSENIYAAYLNYKWQQKKYTIQTGVRAEHTETEGNLVTLGQVNKKNYSNLFPNILIRYEKSANTQYGISYRKSIQRFGYDIVNPFIIYQSQYAYYQGNPAIQPMILHNVELSHTWKNTLFTSISYTYIKDAINTIFRQNDSTKLIINTTENLSSAHIYNASLTWVKTWLKGKWTSTVTTGALYSQYKSAAASIQLQNAKLTGFMNINQALRFNKGFSAEIAGYYYSPVASGVYLQAHQWNLNLGLAKDIMQKKGNLKLNVRDPFNIQEVNFDVQYQQINTHYHYKTESRFINLVFTYKFGSSTIKAAKSRKTGIEDEKSRMGN